MSVLPPFYLVFDISAVLAGRTQQWQGFSKVGDCFVPKVTLQEIEFLCGRATEPQQEQVAREFSRFYPVSGWRETLSIATHPLLKPPEGQTFSARARAGLAVAQTVYGLSRNHPEALVVLVANDQALVKRILALETPNLCGIPLAALLQWQRTQRRPDVVNHHLQIMRSTTAAAVTTGTTAIQRSTTVIQPSNSGIRRTPTASRSQAVEPRRTSLPHRSTRRMPSTNQIISNLLSFAILAVLGLAAWRVISPTSFEQMWKQIPFTERPSRR